MGSSIIKRLFPLARETEVGCSLDTGADLWWQGYSGLSLKRTKAKLRTLLRIRDPPLFLLLHVGGNDLGITPLKAIKDMLLSLFDFIDVHFSSTKIIWSEILPRDWGINNKGLDAARKRINTLAAKQVKIRGGFYLRHVNLARYNLNNFDSDGIHLSLAGNRLLLHNLKHALSSFLKGEQPWFVLIGPV